VQPPLIRSLISKQVPPDQLGTVFGAAATVEAVAQLVWPIATLQTYKSTVGTLPSAFYILGAVGSALSFGVVFTTMRKPSEVASPRMSTSIQADVPEERIDARAEEPTTALLGQSET
jgi:sugar phosphate permease